MTDFKRYNRTASFRGVKFHVRDNGYESGRRLDTHEY
ncbi:MAG: DNA circularization N-terminal domain-containing protein, partial [Alphaproteobacteria bacterium]|nr:DNA circularization N-terminal domain-containing protein [Alphaproteobacteria bacterium]